MLTRDTAGSGTSVTASVARIARFTVARYESHHLVYAVLFVAAVEATAAVVSHPDAAWRPSWATALRTLIVAVLLLYLRMVDEIKDLDYDRVHNPERPLVTGAVGVGELWVAIAAVAVVSVLAAAALSWWSAVLVVGVAGYGVTLWGLENASARIRTGLLLNLVVTYPVQLWIIAFVVRSAMDTGQVAGGWRPALIAVIFAGAFLHFEFARKTAADHRPGQCCYSNALGADTSVVAIVGFAAAPVGADLLLVHPWDRELPWAALPWTPLALLAIPAAAAWSFRFAASAPAPREHPVVPAVVFVLLMYAVLIAQALTWR